MIRKKIFRRITALISNLIISILIIMISFSIIEQRRQIRNYAMSIGILLAGNMERLIQWEDQYEIKQSIDLLLDTDPFFKYIIIIKDGELYAEACVCEGLKSGDLISRVTEYPEAPIFWSFEDMDGRVFFETVVPVNNTDAFIRLGMARKSIDRQLINYLLMMVMVGIILLFSGIIFSKKIARRSTTEIQMLTNAIRDYQKRYNSGEISEATEEISAEELADSFNKLTAERKKAEDKLKKSLKEKNTLLKEIYHRTGNNMQIISSLLFLQCDQCSDPDFMILVEKLDCRIQAMAIAHQLMYDSKDLSYINVNKYIIELSTFLFYKYGKYSPDVRLNHDVADFNMLYDKAIPMGLILNELTSNSLIHAFPEGSGGEINIQFHQDPGRTGRVVFKYSDSGIGLPDGLIYSIEEDSLGLKIIAALAEEQLNGKLSMKNDGGHVFVLEFFV